MGCKSLIASRGLFLFNLFFLFCGAVFLGIGIWLAVDSAWLTIGGVTLTGAPNQVTWAAAVYLTIASGALVFVVGFIGCCSARKEDSRCLLYVYIALVVVCLGAELAAAIIARSFITQFSTTVEENMKYSLQNEYVYQNATTPGGASPVSYNWNVAQSQWKCCGSSNYTDYQGSAFTNGTQLAVPYECCVRKEGTARGDMDKSNVLDLSGCLNEAVTVPAEYKYLYTTGCYGAAADWASVRGTILLAVGVFLVVLQAIGLFIGFCIKFHE